MMREMQELLSHMVLAEDGCLYCRSDQTPKAHQAVHTGKRRESSN